MKICSDGHEAICVEYNQCPLCIEIAKHKIAEQAVVKSLNDLYDTENRLIEVEENVEELESKNDELREELNLFKYKDEEPPDRSEDDPKRDRYG